MTTINWEGQEFSMDYNDVAMVYWLFIAEKEIFDTCYIHG